MRPGRRLLVLGVLGALVGGVIAMSFYLVHAVPALDLQLFAGSAGDSQPAWSPDGSRIAFVRESEDDAGHLYVADADGSDARGLTTENWQHTSPSWFPDSRRIAYGNLDGLYVIDSDSGGQQRIAPGTYADAGLDVSPDGRWIAGGGELISSDGRRSARSRASAESWTGPRMDGGSPSSAAANIGGSR